MNLEASMTHLNFEWGGDKYTWDLTKAGRCTLGYVIIFVTGYHFLHVVMGLLKDLTEARGAKAKGESIEGKKLEELEDKDGKEKRPGEKIDSKTKKKKEVNPDGDKSCPDDNKCKKGDESNQSLGIEENKKENELINK